MRDSNGPYTGTNLAIDSSTGQITGNTDTAYNENVYVRYCCEEVGNSFDYWNDCRDKGWIRIISCECAAGTITFTRPNSLVTDHLFGPDASGTAPFFVFENFQSSHSNCPPIYEFYDATNGT